MWDSRFPNRDYEVSPPEDQQGRQEEGVWKRTLVSDMNLRAYAGPQIRAGGAGPYGNRGQTAEALAGSRTDSREINQIDTLFQYILKPQNLHSVIVITIIANRNESIHQARNETKINQVEPL